MDKRLLACAALCTGDRIADVGTDHGYLPCYMVKNGLCKSAIAGDVAPKPLESAKRHICEQGLDGKISAVLSDGLDSVPRQGITDVVIAGMGGELIADILLRCDWLKDLESPVNLVLQPMTKWDFLRRSLYENGFEVVRELCCEEGKFVYSVMQVKFIGKTPDYECDLKYLYCGIPDFTQEDTRKYILRQAGRLDTVGKGLLKSPQADKKRQGREMIELAESLNQKLAKFEN